MGARDTLLGNLTYNFRKIDWCDDDGLTNTETGDETSSVNRAERTIVTHEDSHTDNPENTELTGSPDTTNAIADQECAVEQKVHVSKRETSKGANPDKR